MRRRNKHLILIAGLGLILILGGFLFLRSAYLLNRVRIVLESELQSRLKHSVTIDTISGNVFTGLNINGIKIADTSPENPPLITLDEIRIRYRLWSLARKKLRITQLHLKQPRANVRMKAGGTINLAELMPKDESETGTKFPVQLLISEISIEDISIEDGIINIEDENGFFKAAIGGIYSRSRVDGPLNNWKYRARLEVRDGRFELNGVETQIDEFRTEFELQKHQGALHSLRLALGNSVLTISGEADNLGKQSPQVKTEAQMTLDFHDVQKILPTSTEIEGVAEVEVEASGPVSEIVGSIGITLPSVQLNALQFENLTVQAKFTSRSVQVTNIDALFASGNLTGAGEINLSATQAGLQRPTYNGWVQLNSLRTEQLLPIIDFPQDLLNLKADVNGEVQFSGNGADLGKINLDGNFQLDNASVNAVPIRLSAARYQLKDEHLSITANLDDAQIEVNGNPGLTGQHDMDLRITKIDTGKLSRILQMPDLAGEGTLTGKSSAGEEDNLAYSLQGLLKVPEATLYDVPIGVLTADFRYAGNQVFLNSIRLAKGESELIADGVALMEGDTPINLNVRAQPLQIADYVRLAGDDYPIEGIATGELVIDGTLARLNGRGTLQIENGKAWELSLDPLTLPIGIENYVVKIPDFELLTRGQKGILNAQIDPNQDYVIDFQSEPMQLAEIAIARGMTDFLLDADLVVTAKGQANAADPLVDVTFDFSNVTYAGNPLEDVYITGIYKNYALNFEGVGFNDTCQIRGVLESIEGIPYQIIVDGVEVDLVPFLRIFNVADYFTGTGDGNVEVEGLLEDPSKVKLRMSLSKVALDVNERQLINPAPIRVSFVDNLWDVQSLVLADKRNGSPFLSAQGTFPVQSAIDARRLHGGSEPTSTFSFIVESDGFPLEGLSYLLGLPPLFSGNISYKFTGDGTYEDPQLELNWNIPALMLQTPVGKIPIREAVGGLVYNEGSLNVESFDLRLLGNPVKVQGNIEVDLESFPASRLNLHASCPNFRLDSSDFENLPDYLNNHLILFDLEAQITGDLVQPELIASIDATQKKLQLLDLPHPIEDLKVALQISVGQKASPDLITTNLKSADWQFVGGRYRASGVWSLPKTDKALPLASIIDVLEQNNSVEFQLHVNGEDVNLVTPLSYILKREFHGIESQANLVLNLEGSGYHPDQMSATLTCNDLHVKVNNREIRNINEIRFHFKDRKLALAPIQLGEGNTAWINAAGAIDLDGTMDLSLELNRLPYGVLVPAITLTLLDQSFLQFDGVLTSQIRVDGDLTNPIISATWESDGHVGNANLKDSGRADYQEKLLFIQNIQRIAGVDKQLEMSGTIPINLAFQPLSLEDRFLDLPIDLKLQGRQISLVPLGLLLHPLIEHADGIADIDLRIQGTTASPYPQGTFSAQQGTLKLANFDTPISNGTFELQADKGQIRITTLSFQVGQGEYTAEVNCALDGIIATDFEISRFSVHKARIADFIGDQSRFLNPTVSRFLPPEATGTETTPAEVLNGYITAEASLKIPINQFLIPGKTAWIPQFIKPFNLPNVIKHVTGQLNIRNVLIEGLGYKIRNPRPIEIQLANQKLSLEEGFSLEDQESTADEAERLRVMGFGSWELGQKLLFHVEMNNLDLGFISGFLPEAYAVRGSLNASLDMRGTDAEPRISFTWETPELRVNQAEVDQFTGSIVYEDRKIRVSGKQDSDAHLSIGKNRAALSVIIPFHLSLLEFTAEPLPADIEGGLDITIEDLEFLSLIFPQFAFTEGMGFVNATLGGQFDSPMLKGSSSLRGFAFELPNSHISLANGTAHLNLTENGVVIQRITGDMNGGTFEINGTIHSNWFDVRNVDLVAEFSEGTTFRKPGLYEVECQSVNLQMKGEITTDGHLELPPLTGSIRVKTGTYKQDWKQLVQDLVDKEAEVQFEVWFDYPIVRDVQLDLNILAPNNFLVESNLGEIVTYLGEIEIETSINGEVVGPIQKPIFSGRVDLLRGELSLSGGHQFEIREGSYAENKNALEFNPWYEITAETVEPIRNVQVPTANGEFETRDIRVEMYLNGYLEDKHPPEFQAEVLGKGAGEDYQLTQRQILSIVAFGGVDPLDSEAYTPTDLVEGYIGSQVAKATGFSKIDFDSSLDNLEQSRILLTKELSERLSLTYSSTFQLHAEPRIEVEYQIRRNFYIKGERNERGKYGIDLKLERRF
ncbi:hypothetical protein C6502_09430 [Candidatus Poribacteria bacterium]|nr:MAG: hypothetical protein C6502_09430 [Candidatus Poribacteria bacterium]